VDIGGDILAVLYVYGSVHHGKLYGIAVEADAEDGAAGRRRGIGTEFHAVQTIVAVQLVVAETVERIDDGDGCAVVATAQLGQSNRAVGVTRVTATISNCISTRPSLPVDRRMPSTNWHVRVSLVEELLISLKDLDTALHVAEAHGADSVFLRWALDCVLLSGGGGGVCCGRPVHALQRETEDSCH